MKAIIPPDAEKAKPKIKKSIIMTIKRLDTKCQSCSKNIEGCEGKCTSFWNRNKSMLLSREERRKRIKKVKVRWKPHEEA